MKFTIALSCRELRERSPAWIKYITTVDRALLRKKREADPLETAFNKDIVRYQNERR